LLILITKKRKIKVTIIYRIFFFNNLNLSTHERAGKEARS